MIDKVEVKALDDLSPREIEHDNPEIRRPEEMADFLGQLYNREVTDDDTVTVIRFSADQAERDRRELWTSASGPRIRVAELGRARSRLAARLARRPRTSTENGASQARSSAREHSPPHCAALRRARSSSNSSNQRRAAAAAEAERDPVAEHLAALLAQPVRALPMPRQPSGRRRYDVAPDA